jgi:hypothetical protein
MLAAMAPMRAAKIATAIMPPERSFPAHGGHDAEPAKDPSMKTSPWAKLIIWRTP